MGIGCVSSWIDWGIYVTLEMVPIDRGDPGGSNHGLEMFIGCILMELCMGISWAGPVPGA